MRLLVGNLKRQDAVAAAVFGGKLKSQLYKPTEALRNEDENMTGAEVMDIGREAIIVLLKVSGPPMIIGLLVGVIIALFQALTQIQEMTLVFVPKIVAIFVTMLVAMPYMAATLGSFMERVMIQIAGG